MKCELTRHNGLEQDDEGAFVYQDEAFAEIDRLKAEVERLQSRCDAYKYSHCQECCDALKTEEEEVESLRTQLADRDALLERLQAYFDSTGDSRHRRYADIIQSTRNKKENKDG